MNPPNSRQYRRAFVATLALSTSLVLASCSAVSDSSAVATVNGTKISRADYEELAQDLLDAKQFNPDANGNITASDSRILIAALTQFAALSEFLELNDESITEADRAGIIDSIQPDDPYFTWPKELQDLSINLSAINGPLSRIPAPAESELKSLYEKSPLATGQLCMRHILVETDVEARSALKKLADGGDFAELALKVSIDKAANEDGGALLGGNGGACAPLTELQGAYDPAFLLGAMSAKVGVATGPVKSSFGYHIILLRPYEEVASSLSENLTSNPGSVLAAGYVATSEISVNSKYGTWNRATAKVE